MEQDVVDLPQQVTSRRVVAHGPVHLGELQSQRARRGTATRTCRVGRARIARVSCRFASFRSPRCTASRAAAAKASTLDGVVVHPMLIDGGERSLHVLGRLRPSPAIHRQHGELGLADDERIGCCTSRLPAADASANRHAAWSTSPVSRCASAHKQSAVSRHGLHGGSWATAKLASASICSGPAAHITARSIARAESNDAEPSSGHQVERRGVDDRRPPLRFGGLPGQHRDPAGQHGQRGILLDGGVAERRRASAARSTSGRPGRSAGSAPSPAGRTGPARSCSAGARGPSPGIRWTRTSRRLAGAASSTTSGSTRRSSPSRNSRNSAW